MQSVPGAMVWEMFHRGRWNLILGLLGANLLPIMIFCALERMGTVEFDDNVGRIIHSTLVMLNMFTFGTAIIASQGHPSRLYTYPVTSATLAACTMIPAMILIAAEMIVSTLVMNWAFHLDWPVWGPALFVAAGLAACQATFWYTEKSAWLLLAITVVSGSMGAWYSRRFLPVLTQSAADAAAGGIGHPWHELTSLEAVLLLLIAIVSYAVGVSAISRNRCGELIKPLGILAWLIRVLDFEPVFSPPFGSREAAQSWFEWQLKGLALPIVVVFGAIVMLTLWLINSREPRTLIDGFMGGGAMLSVVGMVFGIVIGNTGPADSNLEMGQFLASRPITSSGMAWIILKTAFKSVLIGWTLWAVAFAVACGILLLTGTAPQPFWALEFRWWHIPGTLVGTWTVASVVASLVLTGRGKGIVQLFIVLVTLYIGLLVFANFALPWDIRRQFLQGVAAALGIVMVLGSAIIFVAAMRRRVIRGATAGVAGAIWVILSAIVVFEWSRVGVDPASAYIFTVGLGALTVVPMAAAPLALAWNRTR